MLQLDPVHRLSLEEVKAHPWFTMETPTYEEICQEFKMRKHKLDEE